MKDIKEIVLLKNTRARKTTNGFQSGSKILKSGALLTIIFLDKFKPLKGIGN